MKRPRYKVRTKPCERCHRPTKERQEMFDGRRAFLCSACWESRFSDEQRARITQACEARKPKKASARQGGQLRPIQTAACQDCREQFTFPDTWSEDRRRFCRRCVLRRERLDLARAQSRKTAARARPSRRKGAKSGSVWTVSGGLPSLGKRQ